MNFDKYKNKLPYPSKSDFTVTNFYKNGKKVDFETDVIEVIFDEEKYNSELVKYYKESLNLEKKFKQDLFDDLGISDNPKKDMLYSKAFEHGYSADFSEIYFYASDLVDLILWYEKVQKTLSMAWRLWRSNKHSKLPTNW